MSWWSTLRAMWRMPHKRATGQRFAGVGGRAGWKTGAGTNAEIRIGARLGFAFWGCNGDYDYVVGVDMSPHVQYVYVLKHGTVGVGVDFPIMISIDGKVAGGAQAYFRWSVF